MAASVVPVLLDDVPDRSASGPSQQPVAAAVARINSFMLPALPGQASFTDAEGDLMRECLGLSGLSCSSRRGAGDDGSRRERPSLVDEKLGSHCSSVEDISEVSSPKSLREGSCSLEEMGEASDWIHDSAAMGRPSSSAEEISEASPSSIAIAMGRQFSVEEISEARAHSSEQIQETSAQALSLSEDSDSNVGPRSCSSSVLAGSEPRPAHPSSEGASSELLTQARRFSEGASSELPAQALQSPEGASSSNPQGHRTTEGSSPRRKKSRQQSTANLLRITFEAEEEDEDEAEANSDPRPSQEGAVSERGFTRHSALETTQMMTLGRLTRADSDDVKAAGHSEEEAHVHLRLGVPHLLHAGALALSGLTWLLCLADSPLSMLGIALISIYGISVLSMLALAMVRALRPHLQLRHPPLLASCAHLALAVVEVQWRIADGEQTTAAWRSACLQLTVLQISAMSLGGSGGWSVAAAVVIALLAAVMALQSQLSAEEVVQSLLLPGAAMCAAAAHFEAPEGQSYRQRLLTALREFATGRPDVAPDELTNLGEEAMAEKATQLLSQLTETGQLPAHMKSTLKAVASLLKEIPEPRRHQGLSIEEAPVEVQEFIMGVLPDGRGRDSYALGGRGSGLGLAPKTTTGMSVDEHLARLLHTLRYREPVKERLGKAQKKATEKLIRRQLGKWDVDMIRVGAACANRPLQLVGQAAFQPLVEQLGLDSRAVRQFLLSLENRYRSANPYHNSIHAADVLNSVVYFMNLKSTTLSSMPHLDVLAAYTAAASHDVGHDGKSNRFHTVAETPLSQLFNEQSCLENMHCAITFAIFQIKDSNFFLSLASTEWAAFRSAVVHLILDTDLVKHFPFMDAFRRDFLQGTPSMDSPKHRLQLLSAVLKASDVGGSAKPFALHAQWATRINSEFYRQGDEEKQLGLSPSPFCDRAAQNVADSQKGFYQFIVIPLFTDLNGHLLSRRMEHQVIEEVKKNQKFWAGFDSAEFNYEQPVENVPALIKKFNDGLANAMRRSELHGPDGAPTAAQQRPAPVLAPRFNTRN